MYFRCPSAKTVSNASVDFPDPDNPVMTTSWSRGMSTEMFLRLCSRAPRIRIDFTLMSTCRLLLRSPRLTSSQAVHCMDFVRVGKKPFTSTFVKLAFLAITWPLAAAAGPRIVGPHDDEGEPIRAAAIELTVRVSAGDL